MPPKKAAKVATAPTRTSSRVKAKDDASKIAQDNAEQDLTPSKTVKPTPKSKAQSKTTTPKSTRKNADSTEASSQTDVGSQETTNGTNAEANADVVELVSPRPPYTPVSASASSTSSDTKRKVVEKTPSVNKKQKVSNTKSKAVTKATDSSISDSEPEIVTKAPKKKEQAVRKKITKPVKAASESKKGPKKSGLDAWFDTYAGM